MNAGLVLSTSGGVFFRFDQETVAVNLAWSCQRLLEYLSVSAKRLFSIPL